ncbi:hypothetical protein [Methylorubrum sp. SL192]|uniref:hypothetical protein n=1 Tax=Methylorubrum sp. SL192 TaxID=2995167 RepID=UPI00227694F8|nr:hypothetical protein [Methylorubrum sp. SL192]MCY1643010.1 hypothetical protein [Methylorubrum sp. SL192]
MSNTDRVSAYVLYVNGIVLFKERSREQKWGEPNRIREKIGVLRLRSLVSWPVPRRREAADPFMLERIPTKWSPVRRKNARYNNDRETPA